MTSTINNTNNETEPTQIETQNESSMSSQTANELKRKLSSDLETNVHLTDPPPPPLPPNPPDNTNDTQTNTDTVAISQLQTTNEPSEDDLLKETTYQLKKKICLAKLRQLNTVRLQSFNNLNEQFYLEQNFNYLSYTKFLNSLNGTSLKLTNELKDYIQNKFPLDQKHDFNSLEIKLANKFSLNLPETPSQPVSSSSSLQQSQSITSTLDKQHQTIAERAKHEAQIIQRITQLRKEGLWSIKRLPKLVEPARTKSHWDFLLDEMTWMSTDFQQERKWKKNSCKKLSIAIQKYFKDKELKAEIAEREEAKRLRKQAGLIARDIAQFWRNVEKIIEYKHRSLLEEKRKQAMDQHLNFIVDQTEKYSSWLIEGLNQQQQQQQQQVVVQQEIKAKEDDDEYKEESEPDEDDESTIEKEEELDRENDTNDEIKRLQMESEIPIEDLLKDYNLDENYFASYDSVKTETSMDVDEETNETLEDDDEQEDESDSSTIYCTEDEDEQVDKEKQTSLLVEKEETNEPTPEPVEQQSQAQDSNDSKEDEKNKVLNSIAETALMLQPTGYTLETTNVKTKIPSQLLKHTLREYQHVGLDWLVTMNENKLNGILADEMGLGKTIQTIALLAHLACEKGNWGPHLIVVPTSVMLNWELEFKKWCPGFKILTYYGSPKERKLKRQGWTKVNAFHVCITSYKLVIQDHAAFRRKKWKYFILDEAQNIKNFKSQRWQCLLNFQSQRRLLLTGTPLQNNLMELWSLMHFLMPHVFSSHRDFQHWFSNPLKSMIEGNQEYNEQLIRRLHKVLRPFILRRLKIDVEKQMPKKYEHIVMCKLSKRQRLLYDEFMSLSSTKKKLAEGHYMSVINILMQLRKVCNHPDLFEPRPIVSSFVIEPIHYNTPSLVFNLNEDLFENKSFVLFNQPALPDLELMYSMFECHRSKQLQTSRKLFEDFILNTSTQTSSDIEMNQTELGYDLKGLEINQLRPCLKPTQFNLDYTINKLRYLIQTNKWHCSHKPIYGLDLHECIGKRQVFSTSCYRKLLTSLQYAAKSFATCQEAYLFEAQTNKNITTNGFWSNSNTLVSLLNYIRTSLYDAKSNHVLYDILTRFVVYVPHVVYATKMSMLDPFDACSQTSSIRLHVAHPNPNLYQKQRILIEDITNKCSNFTTNFLTAKIDSMMSTQFPEKRLIQYDCGKLQTLADLLRNLYIDTHRVLLFTQMTRMLDILENFLNYHGYKYLRLDGSTSIEQRQILMERFNNDKRIFCFILSTRSGGIGVNLTGADTVIFYDSDWNPTMDAQAQDRCHRIGQTRDVHIYRLISTKTVEENILKKANQKRLLSEMTIEGGCFTTALLKKHHITELFNDDQDSLQSPLEVNAESNEIVTTTVTAPSLDATNTDTTPSLDTTNTPFEDALAMVEDESDVQAAKELKAEVRADIAEFDENNIELIEGVGGEVNLEENNQVYEMNRLENEFKSIETELKPIERYALKFLENYGNIILIEEEKEIEIEKVKADWELNRLKQLKEDEERKAEQEEDDMMYTYSKTEVSSNNLNTTYSNNTLNTNKKKLKLKNKSKLKKNNTTSNNISNMNTRRKANLMNSLTNSPSKKSQIMNSPTKKLLKLTNNNKKRLIRSQLNRQLTSTSLNNNKTTTLINRPSLIDNELVKFKKLNEKHNINNQDLNELNQLDNNNNTTTNKEDKLLSQKQFESSIIKSIKRAAARSIKAAAAAAVEQSIEDTLAAVVVAATSSTNASSTHMERNSTNTIKINTDSDTISTNTLNKISKAHKTPKNKQPKEKKIKKLKAPIINSTNAKFIRHLINVDDSSLTNNSKTNEETNGSNGSNELVESATNSLNSSNLSKKPRQNRKLKKVKTNQTSSETLNIEVSPSNLHTLLLNKSTANFLNVPTDLSISQIPRSKSPTISSLIAQQQQNNHQQQPKVTYMTSSSANQPGTIRTIIRPTQIIPQMPNNSMPTMKTISQKPPTLTLTSTNLTGNKPILITKPLNQQQQQPQTKVIIKPPTTTTLTAPSSLTNVQTKAPNVWILNRPTQVSNTLTKPPLTVVMSSPSKLTQQPQLNNRITILNKDSLIKNVNLLKSVTPVTSLPIASIPTTSATATTSDLTSSANIVNNVLAQTKNINNLMSANNLDSKF